MSRTILLPREFNGRLNDLAALTEEVNGVLLYRSQGTHCPIESVFMTGKGDAEHVKADPERMEIVNEFFRRNSEYKFVKFHTHSAGTIRKFGDYYATHFSEGDRESYDEQLRLDPEFIGMVVTPETKLLYASDNPKLRVVEGFPSGADERINREIREITRGKRFTYLAVRAR